MKLRTLKMSFSGFRLFFVAFPTWAATHVLTGNDLTVDTLWEMSKPGEKVTISPEGWDRINKSYQAILDATKNGISVYGVSVNFGDLKHQKVVTGDVEKEPNRSASINSMNVR